VHGELGTKRMAPHLAWWGSRRAARRAKVDGARASSSTSGDYTPVAQRADQVATPAAPGRISPPAAPSEEDDAATQPEEDAAARTAPGWALPKWELSSDSVTAAAAAGAAADALAEALRSARKRPRTDSGQPSAQAMAARPEAAPSEAELADSESESESAGEGAAAAAAAAAAKCIGKAPVSAELRYSERNTDVRAPTAHCPLWLPAPLPYSPTVLPFDC
jgi:hypothetical protein